MGLSPCHPALQPFSKGELHPNRLPWQDRVCGPLLVSWILLGRALAGPGPNHIDYSLQQFQIMEN